MANPQADRFPIFIFFPDESFVLFSLRQDSQNFNFMTHSIWDEFHGLFTAYQMSTLSGKEETGWKKHGKERICLILILLTSLRGALSTHPPTHTLSSALAPGPALIVTSFLQRLVPRGNQANRAVPLLQNPPDPSLPFFS